LNCEQKQTRLAHLGKSSFFANQHSMAPKGHLLRILGVGFGVAISLGDTVGAGILRTPGAVAAQLRSVPYIMLAWIVGGVCAVVCTLSVIELATMLPFEGGWYVYAHRAYGGYGGFFAGYSDWLGLDTNEVEPQLPIQTVSTGLPFALVPIKRRSTLQSFHLAPQKAYGYLPIGYQRERGVGISGAGRLGEEKQFGSLGKNVGCIRATVREVEMEILVQMPLPPFARGNWRPSWRIASRTPKSGALGVTKRPETICIIKKGMAHQIWGHFVVPLLMSLASLFLAACAGCGGVTGGGTTYTIGGTVSGLLGTGLVLQNNSGDNLAISGNGAFTFAVAIAIGGTYKVTVLTQPSNPAQNCDVTNGSGNPSGNVTNVQVACITLKTITQIQVTGRPVLIFDHTKNQQQSLNIPDLQITAWKEANGTVNLLIPHYEAYRMRGTDLLHLTMDPNEIFSSTQSASVIPENLYNYHHWLAGPYSLDGKTFYSLAHSEWYACLLNANCDQAVTNNESASLNSWANTVNSFVSTDGGASWQLNVVDGNHVVVKMAYVWTGSLALADQVYLHALNHTGMFQPTRIIKEGSSYYAIGFYIQRDFTQINPPNNDQAPVTGYGYVLLRTSDFTNPNEWAAWTGGTNYESLSSPTILTDVLPFLPQQNGNSVNASPPQIVFDTVAQAYILIYTPYGTTNNAVYYITTKSLANPSWSQPTAIGGTAELTTDPGGNVLGFIATNYPSILDNSSTGYNFEFTNGSPLLFWSTFPSQYGGDNLARDVYCVQLTTSYQ